MQRPTTLNLGGATMDKVRIEPSEMPVAVVSKLELGQTYAIGGLNGEQVTVVGRDAERNVAWVIRAEHQLDAFGEKVTALT